MFACICHQVHEREVQACIESGATDEEAIGDACGAGTGCGTCLDRLADMIETHFAAMDARVELEAGPVALEAVSSVAPISPAVRRAFSTSAEFSY